MPWLRLAIRRHDGFCRRRPGIEAASFYCERQRRTNRHRQRLVLQASNLLSLYTPWRIDRCREMLGPSAFDRSTLVEATRADREGSCAIAVSGKSITSEVPPPPARGRSCDSIAPSVWRRAIDSQPDAQNALLPMCSVQTAGSVFAKNPLWYSRRVVTSRGRFRHSRPRANVRTRIWTARCKRQPAAFVCSTPRPACGGTTAKRGVHARVPHFDHRITGTHPDLRSLRRFRERATST